MRRSFVSRALVLALVAGGAAAVRGAAGLGAAASAAVEVPAPILLSSDGASGPGVAVADDGTSHIAWWEDRDDGAVVVYCRLPRGATSCDRREELATADFHSAQVGVVLRDDGTLYLLFNDFFTTFALVSTDGGDSFGEPKAIGTVAPESAVVGPGLNTADDRLLRIRVAGGRGRPGDAHRRRPGRPVTQTSTTARTATTPAASA